MLEKRYGLILGQNSVIRPVLCFDQEIQELMPSL
jgi:hypothetical protein